jgi:cell cycle sensor histidine kinase DivJ
MMYSAPIMLALICGSIAASWTNVAGLASTGRFQPFAALALVLGAVALGVVVASAGGAGSPAALVLVALPVEAWWTGRSRLALQAGCLAAAASLGALVGLSAFDMLPAVPAGLWQWLLPVGYALTLVLRRDDLVTPGVILRDAGGSELDTLSDCAVLRLDTSGDVLSANARSRDVLGLPVEHLMGSALFDRLHVSDRVVYMTALANLRLTGVMQTADLRIRVPAGETGSVIHLFSVSMTQRAADLSVFLLIRNRQDFADLLRQATVASERAASLDVAKGRFLAAVSHELRTPLNAIIGFSDMMIQGMAGPFADPRQAEYVGIVRDSGQHLLSVVNSILDVSKIESGTYTISPEPFRFEEAVEFCRSMLAGQAQAKHVALRVQIERNVGELCGDRRAIQQTLINLVGNAIKFTPEGGAVTVGAHRQGRRLQFWISDTGIGIADCDLAQLGRPFVQLRNDYTRHQEGAGLGLSIVKGLVELHGGTLAVASAPGEGTTVTVTLPVDGPDQTSMNEGMNWMVDHGTQNAETYRKSA